jgi:hypothetical protein
MNTKRKEKVYNYTIQQTQQFSVLCAAAVAVAGASGWKSKPVGTRCWPRSKWRRYTHTRTHTRSSRSSNEPPKRGELAEKPGAEQLCYRDVVYIVCVCGCMVPLVRVFPPLPIATRQASAYTHIHAESFRDKHIFLFSLWNENFFRFFQMNVVDRFLKLKWI